MVFQQSNKSTNTGKFRADPLRFKRNESNQQQSNDNQVKRLINDDLVDKKYGFERYETVGERTGFLINMRVATIVNAEGALVSAMDFYFIEEDGSRFKASLPYQPYFLVLADREKIDGVGTYLTKRFTGMIASVETVVKEDLDLPNHLVGLKQKYLKLNFMTTNDLVKVRKELDKIVQMNKEREKHDTYYINLLTSSLSREDHTEKDMLAGGSNLDAPGSKTIGEYLDYIRDIREYDVAYSVRVSIDLEIFAGRWYTVKSQGSTVPPQIVHRPDLIEWPEPIVLAFDIETTKLPLRFPDSNSDQIMMISYMIDGQGFLITNREIVSADIEDFEYTPRPDLEGNFSIWNAPDEKGLIERFFSHVLEVRPHVFVTYNGDFFDWPFVEARAKFHGLDMQQEIGFSRGNDGVYSCRAASHLDCLCWVKRDSYLPMGSQGLKAVAKAKLRYDPVELDPEEMCPMAVNNPSVLASYSVSDAVATYYLYMKYVHPFIFALCTIIPRDPDEVLRKGSGTLCESLLMVEAYRANVVFPNKQQETLNKLTADGRLLDSETYVGGHVEALESGVFRSDLPCRFRLEPDALQMLMDGVQRALEHTLIEEEKIPLSEVLNLQEVHDDIVNMLKDLRDKPNRIETPMIYHLDVAAMYPNIILTNRLQPSAMVDEMVCAACDFNRPNAKCQRRMVWTWRGEHLPASLNELQRIRAQLETERFPPVFPGGRPRALHELNPDERAALEKKRLSEYCRTAYKKTKVTRIEERCTTVCQRENSFYVDTVRAFRDRRYEYKGLNKLAKKQVSQAIASGDIAEIKSAKNREVLYDSLQLAHKCILNSFYGYVMRRGARWYSMEMAGIVCHTGANIIRQAREIIEQVGRPLELDTDGIWCVLPASFPENFEIRTSNPKKSKVVVSYPNAVLNLMVRENYTNDQYQTLVDGDNLKYETKSENSIFFEVDGPYRAMVLPASKEEGKRLKKRYAVFNDDGSLAELKGFEVKRRGELRLIKVFQSAVFEAFLKGDTLDECYANVAKVADYWLDVLYTKASNLSDTELMDLVSENRSMSKKLEEYGAQKSTSISTAKRLAEFLGDQMVKDAGLACRFIVSKQPEGSPVTDRAVPVAIFQAEESVKRHYLCRWLKDSTLEDFDIRSVLDWGYYIERLGGCIQKIVTIPAAMQGVANPVPRVRHPDWLHRKLAEKGDSRKQRKIDAMFQKLPPRVQDDLDENGESAEIVDVEDLGQPKRNSQGPVVATCTKRKFGSTDSSDGAKDWRSVLGNPPKPGEDLEEWLEYHKKKWKIMADERKQMKLRAKLSASRTNQNTSGKTVSNKIASSKSATSTIGGFLRRAQHTLLTSTWQVIQLAHTSEPGVFKLWALVGSELHQIRLVVPRIFYVNRRSPMPEERAHEEGSIWRAVNRNLPRGQPVNQLYRYTVPEEQFQKYSDNLIGNLSMPDIIGVYETQVPLDFRALVQLGCVCGVAKGFEGFDSQVGENTFTLEQLHSKGQEMGQGPYLSSGSVHALCMCVFRAPAPSPRALICIIMPPTKKAVFVAVDSVRTNQMPNISALYTAERNARLNDGTDMKMLPPPELAYDVKVETDLRIAFRQVQRALQSFKEDKKGPTMIALQSTLNLSDIMTMMPGLSEFPVVQLQTQTPGANYAESDEMLTRLDWQRLGTRAMLKRYLDMPMALEVRTRQCRYLHLPLGNLPAIDSDAALFATDLMFSRHLLRNNFILWCSNYETPDLGGKEADDYIMMASNEDVMSITVNNPGCYTTVCMDLSLQSITIGAVVQSEHINDIEGTGSSVAFDRAQPVSVSSLAGASSSVGGAASVSSETSTSSGAMRIMKNMVAGWLRDCIVHKNVFSDVQLVHFYHWLCSPHTLLYDPALRQAIQLLSKKLFLQLVAEFRRMGSSVVFANLNRIIISTKKTNIVDAVTYTNFVVDSISNKELFHCVDVKFKDCWQYLLWQGPTNYAGVKGKVTDDMMEEQSIMQKSPVKSQRGMDEIEEDEEGDEEGSDGEASEEPEIEMEWSLAMGLPNEAGCRENFNALVAGYVSATFMKLLEAQVSRVGQEDTPVRKRTMSQATPLGSVQQSAADYAKSLISGDLGQKLYHIIDQLNRKLPGNLGRFKGKEANYLTTMNSELGSPALEFTKAICKVLELDSTVQIEVGALRRNMLRLIGVSEFSDQAEWKDPCDSVVLSDVLCHNCSLCFDLDLVKNCLWQDLEDPEDKSLPWECPGCRRGITPTEVEFLLIEHFNKRMISYNLQDLQCSRCRQVKMENMPLRCACASPFITLQDPKQFGKYVYNLSSLAQTFKMSILFETMEWATTR
ncbi:DNA polymerase epsilon catalytic subunit 1 [Cloeon dipterum]|uniref:DNA polymerase epsilon catalytic subunit 1 n=1 Tax=Cloeon dipterum TaxID=197152 RepID=UPI00321FF29B